MIMIKTASMIHEISLKYDEFILNVISSIITDWEYL